MANPSRYSTSTQVTDLLCDDYFIISTYNPTTESQLFWKNLILNGLLKKAVFEQAQQLLLSQEDEMPAESSGQLWQRIMESNQKKYTKTIWLKYGSVAAAVLLFIGFSVWQFRFTENSKQAELSHNEDRGKHTDEIRLITADNQQINITGTEAHIDYSSMDSVRINNRHIHKDQELGKTAYNTIIVPYGKRTSIILADNSKIWINAGTTVRYPVAFNGQTRTIYVEGEVYGDITKDPNKPFVFKTEKFDVKVLGTSLNISAYQQEPIHSVVLVSGAVKVEPIIGKEMFLSPSEAYFSLKDEQKMATVDTDMFTSWTRGYYQYKNQRLETIINNLRRYYGVDIHITEEMRRLSFTGSLELKDDVARVISGLSNSIAANLTIKNGKYILSK